MIPPCPSLSAMARLLAAPGVLVLGTCVLLVDALLGGELVELPPVLLLAALAGYAAGAWSTPSLAAAAAVLAAGALTAASQLVSPGAYPALDDLVFFLVAVGGPATAGAALAGRARQVRELRRLAGHIAEQRDAEVRSARAEERTRVEVGLHRGFSEDLAAIAMRAESARDRPDDEVRRALAEIETSARRGLDRLREALGTLRETPEPDETAHASGDDGRSLPVARTRRGAATPEVRPPDVALGVVAGAALAVETVVSDAARGPIWAGLLTAGAIGAALVLHRSRPVMTLAGLLGGLATMTVWLTPPMELVSTLLPLSVAAYAVGAHLRGPLRWLAVAVLAVALTLLELARPEPGDGGLGPLLAWVGLAVLAGVATAGRAARAEQLAAYVEELRDRRDVEVHLATAEQRAALARDLHDTVAHALTVVCLQASAAQVAPERPDAALAVVADAARHGLSELRDGLDGLGDAQALAAEELAGHARRAGVHPEVSVVGPVGALSPTRRLLVTRVVREALTNAGRYAPGARVAVTLSVDAGVDLDISDSGGSTSAWAHGAGTGLQALRDEVEGAGGTLVWGLTPAGFRVCASLPAEVLV